MSTQQRSTFRWFDERKSITGDVTWTAGTILTNPTNGTVLVDSGALAAGSYNIYIVGTTSVLAVFDVEHRNSANDTTLKAQRRRILADSNDEFEMFFKYYIAQSERIRVTLVGNIAGNTQFSIILTEVA